MSNSKKGRSSQQNKEREQRRLSHSDEQKDDTVVDASSLFERAQQGDDDAIEQLVQSHQNIAISMAKAHDGRNVGYDELLDCATHLLRIAAIEFQTSRSGTFHAFAKAVVKNGLADLFRERSLRSRHEREQAAKFVTVRARLAQTLGRSPTFEETYDELHWSKTQRQNHGFAEQRRAYESIDKPLAATGELPENKNAEDPSEEYRRAEEVTRLKVGINTLDEMSRRVIVERFFNPDFPSQKATAQRLGITEHRERLLEENALRTLKQIVEGTDAAKTTKDASPRF